MRLERGSQRCRIARPWLGLALAGALIAGCGDDSNPDAVELDELKPALGLKIVDQGNGTVHLLWTSVNNEDDFTGFNIYGAKIGADNTDIAAKEGTAIKLLNDSGEPENAAKELLDKMDYNGENWETPGTAEDEDGDFAFYPYYAEKDGEDPILPSCIPAATTNTDAATGGQICEALTAGTKGTERSFVGKVAFPITGLTVGSEYCFLVMATLDSGEKVASASSEIACVTPRGEITVTGATAVNNATATSNATYTGQSYKTIDFETLRSQCAAGNCDSAAPVFAQNTDASDAVRSCSGADGESGRVCIEHFTDTPFFTAGRAAVIQDLGYYENGFNDATLPIAPPLITFNEVLNRDGYSTAGQSLPIEDKHMYVVAWAVDDTATEFTSFYYHWIYVDAYAYDSTNKVATFDMTMRISNLADDR